MIDRRLRMASSSPDVKALFNGAPSHIYPKLSQPLEQTEEDGSEYNFSGEFNGEPVEDNWTPLPPIVSRMVHPGLALTGSAGIWLLASLTT
jgi:hypothetical protein